MQIVCCILGTTVLQVKAVDFFPHGMALGYGLLSDSRQQLLEVSTSNVVKSVVLKTNITHTVHAIHVRWVKNLQLVPHPACSVYLLSVQLALEGRHVFCAMPASTRV